MDQKEIKMLKIIEALEKNATHSQRKLSKELNISLGLVNSLVQHVVKKGYIEISSLNKNKTKYILTPKGMAEKTVLTHHYIQHSIFHYNYIRQKISGLIETLSYANKNNIVLFGANELAEIACILIKKHGLNLIAIVDNDKVGDKMNGITIVASSFLCENYFDALIMTQMGDLSKKIPPIRDIGVENKKIFHI